MTSPHLLEASGTLQGGEACDSTGSAATEPGGQCLQVSANILEVKARLPLPSALLCILRTPRHNISNLTMLALPGCIPYTLQAYGSHRLVQKVYHLSATLGACCKPAFTRHSHFNMAHKAVPGACFRGFQSCHGSTWARLLAARRAPQQ